MKQTIHTQNHIKLVVSDVDGTLVLEDRHARPTKLVIQTATRLHKKGITFCCASGRDLEVMDTIIKPLQLKSYLILEGGSKIYDLKSRRYVWEKNLEKDVAQKLLTYLEKQKHEYLYKEDNRLLTSLRQAKSLNVSMIVIQKLTQPQIEAIKKVCVKYPTTHTAEVGSWFKDKTLSALYITHNQATKQYAIFELLKLTGIPRENSLGIGDKPNDIPLLSACGVKVAMGNADPVLKEIADYVTKTVEEDGFAHAMEKYIFKDFKQ